MLHKHHIVPAHAGGADIPENVVFLTPSEHAEAHRRLYELHRRWQDRVAWHGLAGIISHEEAVHLACGHMRGKRHSPETIAKMHKPKTKEHAAKVGLTKRGVPRKLSTRLKISETRQLRQHLYKKMSGAWLRKFVAKARRPKTSKTRLKMAIAKRRYWFLKRFANGLRRRLVSMPQRASLTAARTALITLFHTSSYGSSEFSSSPTSS